MSNEGKLKNKKGENLNVVVHKAMDTDYSDVGECSSYIATMRNLAKDDAYLNIPKSIKEEVREHVQDNIIFNADVKKGSDSTIKIKGSPNTNYDIKVYYKSGVSKSKELVSKESDSEGYVEWVWKVPSNVKNGSYKFMINDKEFEYELR